MIMFSWRLLRRKRQRFLSASVVLLLIFSLITLQHYKVDIQHVIETGSKSTHRRNPNILVDKHALFWRALYSLILENKPQCNKKPDLVVPRNPLIRFDANQDRARPDVLWVDDADVKRLRSSHASFIEDIRSLNASPIYEPGTQGIVTTTSEPGLAILSISLHMLRKTGTTLPVEVFLSKPSPYSDTFCSEVFQALGAECRYLSDIFATAETSVTLHTYQYKAFTVLFSSFEDILLLDSDAWPLRNPEPLFHSSAFVDTGLILWPDFWYPSESPFFFDVAQIKNPPPLTARPATESGEMMYSKSKHGLSIMLATYYNYYGPDYYYILQSQGGPGEGDKETFPWAAAVMNESAYFVKHPIGSLGRIDSNGEYLGTGMIQHDPIQDYQYSLSSSTPSSSSPLPSSSDQPILEPSSSIVQTVPHSKSSPPRPFFIHANHPKFDPYTIFDDEVQGLHTPTRDTNGTFVRCWLPEDDAIALFGFDVEKHFWTTIEDSACGDLLGLWLGGGGQPDEDALEHVRRRDQRVCDNVKKYNREVFGTKI